MIYALEHLEHINKFNIRIDCSTEKVAIVLLSTILPPLSQHMKILEKLAKRIDAIKKERIMIQLHGSMALA